MRQWPYIVTRLHVACLPQSIQCLPHLCLQHHVGVLCSFYSRLLYTSLSCLPKGFLHIPLFSKETDSFGISGPCPQSLAPRSPLPVLGLECCTLSPRPFQTLPVFQGLSSLCLQSPPAFPRPPPVAVPITCCFHFSRTYLHWLHPASPACVHVISSGIVTTRGQGFCFSFSFIPIVHTA